MSGGIAMNIIGTTAPAQGTLHGTEVESVQVLNQHLKNKPSFGMGMNDRAIMTSPDMCEITSLRILKTTPHSF